MTFHVHLVVRFAPLYNAVLLCVFNIQIFIKYNQSLIFILVFVQNESNNFIHTCDGALLILCVTKTMTLIHCGLRPHTCAMIKTTREAFSCLVVLYSYLSFQFNTNHAIFLNNVF